MQHAKAINAAGSIFTVKIMEGNFMGAITDADFMQLRNDVAETKKDVSEIKSCLMGSMDHPDRTGLIPQHKMCQDRLAKYEAKVIDLCREVESWKGALNGVKISWAVIIALAALLIKFL